jgi:hypothetical protein
VRQRLEALITARAVPERTRRERSEARPPADLRSYGSIYLGYRRASAFREAGEVLLDSSLYTDVYVDTRLTRETLTVRSEMSGGYRFDLRDGRSPDEARISSMFLDVDERVLGVSGSIGRLSRSTGGVLGRYDGLRLGYRPRDRWELGAVAGFPVDSPTTMEFDFDRYFGGLSLDVGALRESVDLQLFAIGQANGELLDRAAVGGELRYFQDGRMLAAYVDYDFHFQSLNVAQLVGTWRFRTETSVNLLLDYRNVPFLTKANALIGQTTRDLDELLGSFSKRELRSLAEDRTARSASVSLGISHALTERLQLAADVSISNLSGTDASGGVEATPGTGLEFSYFGQLIANDVLTRGDVGVVSLRYFDGSNVDLVSAALDGRYPITPRLLVNPRLVGEFRTSRSSSETFALRPSLRFDYRFWVLRLDSDAGLEWLRPVGSMADDQLGYFVRFGARYDF